MAAPERCQRVAHAPQFAPASHERQALERWQRGWPVELLAPGEQQFPGVAEARGGIGGQEPSQQALPGARCSAQLGFEVGGKDASARFLGGGSSVRRPPAQHLEEDGAQGIEVLARIGRAREAAQALRWEVGERAVGRFAPRPSRMRRTNPKSVST